MPQRSTVVAAVSPDHSQDGNGVSPCVVQARLDVVQVVVSYSTREQFAEPPRHTQHFQYCEVSHSSTIVQQQHCRRNYSAGLPCLCTTPLGTAQRLAQTCVSLQPYCYWIGSARTCAPNGITAHQNTSNGTWQLKIRVQTARKGPPTR